MRWSGAEAALEGLAHNALRKANRDLMESVQPYGIDHLRAVLHGISFRISCGKAGYGMEVFAGETKDQREQMIQNEMRSTAGEYVSMTGESLDVRVKDEKWSYVMLPVWTVTYRGKDQKIYFYAMNGQSGKTQRRFSHCIRKAVSCFSGMRDRSLSAGAFGRIFLMIKRSAVLILTFVLLVFCPTISLSAQETETTHVYDEAGLLSDEEAAVLEQRCREIETQNRIHILMVTTEDTEGKTQEEYADDFYDSVYPEGER